MSAHIWLDVYAIPPWFGNDLRILLYIIHYVGGRINEEHKVSRLHTMSKNRIELR